MNLINKDFVTAAERINTMVTIKRKSPLHLARIYQAAEKEALNKMGIISKNQISNEHLEAAINSVLCRWIAADCTTSIIL